MALSPLNLVGTETAELLSRGAGAAAAAAACAIGTACVLTGRGGRVTEVKLFGKGRGSSGSSTGSNHCNLR